VTIVKYLICFCFG